MKNLLSKISPHLLSVLGFIVVSFLLYTPQITENKRLDQHDILQGVGTNKQLKDHYEDTEEIPLWNNYVFSGMPAYLDGIVFYGDLLKHVQKYSNLGIPRPAHITFRMFVAFYFMLIMFGVRPWIAFAGALTFGMNGFNVISILAGHNMKADAVSYIPLVLGAIHYAFVKNRITGSILLALFLGLQIHTGHYQMTYYLLLIVLVYGLVFLIKAAKEKHLKPFIFSVTLMVLSALLAVGANAGKILTTLEYSKYSTRGPSDLAEVSSRKTQSSGLDRSYAFRYSNGIFEPFFLFIPNIMGGASNQSLDEDSNLGQALRRAGMGRPQIRQQLQSVPTYWGDQPLSAPYYAGMVAVFLFVLSLFYLDKYSKYFLLAIIALGILLSWGSNFSSFNYFMFDYFPGYNKFRSVTFAIIISLTGIALAGFLGLEKFLTAENNKLKIKNLMITVGITAGFALLLIIISGSFGYSGSVDSRLPDAYRQALLKDRKSLLIGDAVRAIIYCLVAGGLIWAYIRSSFNKKIIIGLIIGLIFIDMFSLTKRYLNEDKFVNASTRKVLQETPADRLIKQNTGPGDRVLNLQNPFNETRTSYHHESLGGYHGAKMQRYQELIEYHLQPNMQSIIQNLQSGSRDFSSAHAVNMLNTRYFLAGSAENAAIPNPHALGRAWSVSNVKTVNNALEEIESLNNTDLVSTAVVDQSRFSVSGTDFTKAVVELQSKEPNKLTYTSKGNGNAFIVFSEIHYPVGWTATIDGEETDIKRANYVLRALEVPAGEHTIEFSFHPSSYFTGNTIALIINILLLALVALLIGREVYSFTTSEN